LQAATPARLLPGMGLRPGAEHPGLEPFVTAAYAALYDAVATFSESGIGVAVATEELLTVDPDSARKLAPALRRTARSRCWC
jgi:chloramphenicol 3-O-phosphotransferase